MTHRADTRQVFWSEEDWLDEIAELDAKAAEAEAVNGTATARFWRDRAEKARRAFREAGR